MSIYCGFRAVGKDILKYPSFKLPKVPNID